MDLVKESIKRIGFIEYKLETKRSSTLAKHGRSRRNEIWENARGQFKRQPQYESKEFQYYSNRLFTFYQFSGETSQQTYLMPRKITQTT